MKDLAYLVLVLVVIAGSLFAVFTFLATMEFGEILGVGMFLLASLLLMGGYIVALMLLAIIGFAALTKLMSKAAEHPPTKNPA